MIVMMMAITPSLNASTRLLVMMFKLRIPSSHDQFVLIIGLESPIASLYPRPCHAGQTQPARGHFRWRCGQPSVSAHATAIKTGRAAGRKVSSGGRADLELHQFRRHSDVRVDAIQFGFAQ